VGHSSDAREMLHDYFIGKSLNLIIRYPGMLVLVKVPVLNGIAEPSPVEFSVLSSGSSCNDRLKSIPDTVPYPVPISYRDTIRITIMGSGEYPTVYRYRYRF
jgi:hypothetical protein